MKIMVNTIMFWFEGRCTKKGDNVKVRKLRPVGLA